MVQMDTQTKSINTFTVQLVEVPEKSMVRSSTYLCTGVVCVPVTVAAVSDLICMYGGVRLRSSTHKVVK